VRRSRRRFWKSANDEDKNSAYQTLHYVLVQLSVVLAPFTPFLAEELYKNMTGGESVHLLDWPEAGEIAEKVLADMQLSRDTITDGLALRMDREDGFGQIKVRQPLSSLRYAGKKLGSFYEQIIAEEVNVKRVVHVKSSSSSVQLDKTLTEELKREGFVRELIRLIQSARKNAGLNIDDRIKLSVSDIELIDGLPVDLVDLIRAETLATKFSTDVSYAYKETAEIDGRTLVVSFERV
jgi:isoleucyl-tRNA synthetase